MPSGEQIGASRCEPYVGSGFVQFQPTPCDGELQAGAGTPRARPCRQTGEAR
jgi:hypothetical protein